MPGSAPRLVLLASLLLLTGLPAHAHNGAVAIAVEAHDQSIVVDTSSTPDWNTQDACEVYIDVVHGRDNAPGGQ